LSWLFLKPIVKRAPCIATTKFEEIWRASMQASVEHWPAEELLGNLRGAGTEFPFPLEEIEEMPPVLVFGGSDDNVIPYDIVAARVKMIPGSTLFPAFNCRPFSFPSL
jgi:hypothetical protein